MYALSSYLPGLLKISGQASLLIALVLAAQWLCGGRLPPRWRSALWLLVLLRLALPWTVPSPASLFNLIKLPPAMAHAQSETPLDPMPDEPSSEAGTVASPVSSPGGSWLAWLWAAGALCLASCAALTHLKLNRQVRRLRPLIDE